MDMELAEELQMKVRNLPPRMAREVLEFTGYLEYRHGLPTTDTPDDRYGNGHGQTLAAFRGSGKGGGTERLLAERSTDLAREA